MALEFIENYWDDPELKSAFNKYLDRIFNFNLNKWNEMGYWDYNYRPFSFMDRGRIVSNVCLYSMDMVVNGKRCRVAQISAVGTDIEYRQRGLSSQLTQKAMEWARDDHDFIFLFADSEAQSFYQKRGFKPLEEYKMVMPADGTYGNENIRKLDIENPGDRILIHKLARGREPVSNLLGVLNARLFMFHCIYFFPDNIFYIEELDTLVLYRRKGDVVSVFDIVGKKIYPFSEIYTYIGDARDKTVEFMFMVDRLEIPDYQEVSLNFANGAHIDENFPLNNRRIIFPYTSMA